MSDCFRKIESGGTASTRIYELIELTCTIIIDKSLVWYGSVNALGFYSDKDNIIKLKDDRIAAEMLNVLFG